MQGVDTYTTILGLRLYDRYLDLRTALVALNEKLDGRTPTLIDFLPLSGIATAFKTASDAQHMYVHIYVLDSAQGRSSC